MDRSPFLNIPSHGVTYCLAAVGDGDQILMMVEPCPAVGAARVALPFAAVDVMGFHRAIDGALNGLLPKGHHRPVPKGQDLLHLVCRGLGDCVGDHGLGLNYRKHSTDRERCRSRILRKSDPLPTLGDIGSPLLPRLLSGEQLSVTVLVVNDDQTGATPHGRVVPVEATVGGNLNVHGGWLRLIESYHGSGAPTPPNLKKIRTYSTGCGVPLPSGIPGRIAPT